MTINRLVIAAVVTENRPVREVAVTSGVSTSWNHLLLDRYRREGEAAYEPRPRRPKTIPNAAPDETVDLILEPRAKLTAAGPDVGPDTIGRHLTHHPRAIPTTGELVHRLGRTHTGTASSSCPETARPASSTP